MNDIEEKRNRSALELSIIPAILASSCCLTIPGLSLIGFSFAERLLTIPDWILRLAAFVFLLISVIVFLFLRGVRSLSDVQDHKRYIVLLTVQTLVFALLIYLISLHILVPVLCELSGVTMCRS